MRFLFCWIVTYFVQASCILAQRNLYETLRNNENTTKFADLIDNAGLRTALEQSTCSDESQCLTLFAPDNSAVDALTQQTNWANLASVAKMKIINDHVIRASKPLTANELMQYGTALNLMDVGFGLGRQINFALSSIRYAFHTQVQTIPSYFINSALLVTPNTAATNGMVHVINRALYTPNNYMPIVDYLLTQPDLRKSAELWFKLGADGKYRWLFSSQNPNSNFYATFFIVTDEGWSKVPDDQMNLLQTNNTLLAEVLSYQYFPKQLVYSQWTVIQPQIRLLSGFPQNPSFVDPTKLRSSLLHRSQSGIVSIASGLASAQVTAMGQEINMGIVHKVSSALGYIYETREEVVKQLNANLLLACQADSECNGKLQGSGPLTFFVPSDAVWSRFTGLPESEKTVILKYLVISGLIDRDKMTPAFRIQIDALPNAIRFRLESEVIYVEGRLPDQGYVGARLTSANRVATNGIAHSVDGIPGLAFQTVKEYLAQTSMYSKFNSYAFVETQTKGGPYIYLAPTNDALKTMENDTGVGAELLKNRERRNYIFRRHAFPLVRPFEYLSLSQYYVPTANLAYTHEQVLMSISVPSTQRVMTFSYEGVSSDVLSNTGGYQFKDGILYCLNKLIYMEADLTRNLCTSAGCG